MKLSEPKLKQLVAETIKEYSLSHLDSSEKTPDRVLVQKYVEFMKILKNTQTLPEDTKTQMKGYVKDLEKEFSRLGLTGV